MRSNVRILAGLLLVAVGTTTVCAAASADDGVRGAGPTADREARVIPFRTASVTSADGRLFEIAWSAPVKTGDVELYASDSVSATGALTTPRWVGRGHSSGDVVINDPPLGPLVFRA